MHDCRVSALPVLDDDGRLVGVVSESDLLLKEDADVLAPHLIEGKQRRLDHDKALAADARGLMTSPAVTIAPEASVMEAAHRMRERRVKRLFVTDPEGAVVGVVSRVDLLLPFLRADTDIAADVEGLIRVEPGVVPDTFLVEVHDGVVHLTGEVERRTIAPALVAETRGIDGVVGVDSHITWQYDDTVTAGFGAGWVGV